MQFSLMPSKKELHQAMAVFSAVYSDKQVPIHLKGEEACTDGSQIYLPEYQGKDLFEIDDGFAMLIHETNHLKWTDFGDIGKVPYRALLNALEDIRIDRQRMESLPGYWLIRHKFIKRKLDAGLAAKAVEEHHPMLKVAITLYWYLLEKVFQFRFSNSPLLESLEMLHRLLPHEAVVRMAEIAVQAAFRASTGEVAKDCEEITKILEEHLKTQKTQNSEPDSGTPPKPKAQRGRRKVHPREESTKIQRVEGNSVPPEVFSMFLDDENRSSRGMSPSTFSSHEELWPIQRSKLPEPSDFPDFLSRVGASRKEGQKLERFLKSNWENPSGISRAGQRINPSQLAKLFIGNPKVFQTNEEKQVTRTAVYVLLDRSGSMSGDMMDRAKEAAFAATAMLSNVKGVRVGALAFPGLDRKTLLELKALDEPVMATAPRFASVYGFGFTPIPQSVEAAGAVLREQPEKRRYIVIITDGLCCEGGLLTQAVESCRKDGIETLCLSIGDDSPKLFEHQANITEPSEVAPSLFELMLRCFSNQKHG